MTKELFWVVLVLAIILETYLSHVEDRRHKEVMANLEARKLEVQARMREADKDFEAMKLETELKLAELDKAKERRDREFKTKLAELDKAHAERNSLESRAETPAESREALRRVHATNDRVERGNR